MCNIKEQTSLLILSFTPVPFSRINVFLTISDFSSSGVTIVSQKTKIYSDLST